MTEPFELWVEGRPRSKERPRLGRRRKAYTPAATLNEEDRIAEAWRQAGGPRFEGSVAVFVDYYPEGQLIRVEPRDWHSPLTNDVDNMTKLTVDALQKCAFDNDRFVVETWCAKHPRGHVPDHIPL